MSLRAPFEVTTTTNCSSPRREKVSGVAKIRWPTHCSGPLWAWPVYRFESSTDERPGLLRRLSIRLWALSYSEPNTQNKPNKEPTSGLEPLTCSLGVIHHALPGVAKPAFLNGLFSSALHRVAPYCVPGGVRVVSNERGSRIADPFTLDGRAREEEGLNTPSTPRILRPPPVA